MNRTAYKNQYTKEHYDRINLVIPKGQKERIKHACYCNGVSVNDYLFRLISVDLSGESRVLKQQGFTDEQIRLLDKWQVAQKYREMIESMDVEEINGMNKHYTIILKQEYVNDVTGTRIIHCDKTAELRRLIVKTHKKG